MLNRVLINMINNQIQSISEEKRQLEQHKCWRKIPMEIKSKYYEAYNILLNGLYDTLDDLESGKEVSFEKYHEITDLGLALAEFLIEILKNYDIEFKVL